MSTTSDLSKLSTMKNGPMYLCRAFVHVNGKPTWHSWHNSVSGNALMRSVMMEYVHRTDTSVIKLIMCEIEPIGGVYTLRIADKLARGPDDNVLMFHSPGAAEAYAEQLCRL